MIAAVRLGLHQHHPRLTGELRAEARPGDAAADDQDVAIEPFFAAVTVWKAAPSRGSVMFNAGITQLALLGTLAAMLVVAAAVDVRTFTISNRLNLAVALLAPAYWWSVGLPMWPGAAVQVGVAMAVFALLAGAFYAGMMGGGDVKLAAALALWFSPLSTVRFLVIMSIAGGALTLGLLAWHRWRKREGRPEIPYGVAIAVGGLAILTQRFLNQFA